MLDRETIKKAFALLSDELASLGVLGEINLVGGTAMVLAFNARESTKDVDAIFEPSAAIRAAAARVSDLLNLPEDWINDAAKGFLSPSGEFELVSDLNFPNLRVLAPTPSYMLAMKVLASRSGMGAERGDVSDIATLIQILGLRRAEQVMEIVSRYYDPSRILPRSMYLVDEILEELNSQ